MRTFTRRGPRGSGSCAQGRSRSQSGEAAEVGPNDAGEPLAGGAPLTCVAHLEREARGASALVCARRACRGPLAEALARAGARAVAEGANLFSPVCLFFGAFFFVFFSFFVFALGGGVFFFFFLGVCVFPSPSPGCCEADALRPRPPLLADAGDTSRDRRAERVAEPHHPHVPAAEKRNR